MKDEIDYDEYDSVIDDSNRLSREIDVSEKDSFDKLTSVESVVQDLEHRLRGYKKTGRGDKWNLKNAEAKVGEKVILTACSLLQAFSNRAMLLIDKDKYDRSLIELRNTLKIIDYLCLEDACPAKEYSIVVQMFENALENILDILKSSRELMKDSVGMNNSNEEKSNY